MPNRNFSSPAYRYGFQGQEKDDELKGEGNSYDFGARMLDPRVGRWFSTDNVIKAEKSLYQFAGNNPIANVDPDGNDEFYFNYLTGEVIYRPALGKNKFFAFIPGDVDKNKKQIYIPLDPHDFNKGTALKDFTMTYTEQTLICWPFTYDRKDAHWETVAKFVNASPELGKLLEESNDSDDQALIKRIHNHNAGLNVERLLTSFADGVALAEGILQIPKLIKLAPKITSITIAEGKVLFSEKAKNALFELGAYSSHTSIKNGVGKVTIGYSKTLSRENMKLVEEAFKNNGATSIEIMSGKVKPKLGKFFDKLIKENKSFNGYKIEKTSFNPINDYKFTKELK